MESVEMTATERTMAMTITTRASKERWSCQMTSYGYDNYGKDYGYDKYGKDYGYDKYGKDYGYDKSQ